MLLSRKILQLINEGEIDPSFRRDDKLRKDEKVKDIIFSKINNLKLVMPKNEASVFWLINIVPSDKVIATQRRCYEKQKLVS